MQNLNQLSCIPIPTSLQEHLKKFTYHIDPLDTPPIAGMYLVGLGKKGINTIYLIYEVRRVNQKKKNSGVEKYGIKCLPVTGLKEYTVYDPESGNVWVKGELAAPSWWLPRTKKN